MTRTGHFLTVLACVYLIGGHWAVLQSVAWMGMLADYGQGFGMREAVVMTFDGAHPCSLCRHIQETKQQQEGKNELPAASQEQAGMKVKFFPPQAASVQRSNGSSCLRWAGWVSLAVSRREAPPQPVPRVWG